MILANRDALVRVFENSTSIVICVEVIRCRENGNHRWKFFRWRFTEHRVAIVQLAHESWTWCSYAPRILGLVSADDA